MPAYPASMSALPQPMIVPARWQSLRVTAAVLCFVAMVMTVVALFVPLYSGEISTDLSFGPSDTMVITYTPWAVEYNDPALNASPVEVPRVGYPIVFAVVILAAAACACWYAATPSAGRTAGRAAGVVSAIAGAFLIGTVWTIALVVTNAVDTIITFGSLSQGITTEANYLVGYWLLMVATFLGFAAAVLALVPARQRVWQPPEGPYGFASTGAHPMASMAPTGPAAGQAVAYAVDPLTGQLLPGPPVAPYTNVDPLTGEPIQPAPAAQNGQPTSGGMPIIQPATGDPWTGQPSPSTGTPWTGQPNAPSVDPLTGLPSPPGWTSAATGQPSPPAGLPAVSQPVGTTAHPQPGAVDPLTGQPLPQAVPFTAEPVPASNVPATTIPASNGVPVQLPDPPAPEPPRGPAIPDSEDPLAEPPRP
jgi:integrin beta 8